MKICWLAGALAACCLLPPVGARAEASAEPATTDQVAARADEATFFRVFLKDGASLISYGELARVGDRVVFSMPTSASMPNPQLHLVSINADHVDWDRTTRYAESARAARYMATMAESHYATLTAEIGQALNDISLTTDPARRLAIVGRARKTLADWPASHFNYKKTEIDQMLASLDEAIAELRAAAGIEKFDLSFVASIEPSGRPEPLLPRPTPQEAIAQTLLAARLAESPADRVSLMAVTLATLDREADALPSDWRAITRNETRATIAAELQIDTMFHSFASRVVRDAAARARAADVRAIERVLEQIRERDRDLGAKRPVAMTALRASVEAELEGARRLRLARDRWSLRMVEFRKYRASLDVPMGRLGRLRRALEDIRSLAGPSPDTLAKIQRTASQALMAISAIVPPEEFRTPHALLVSAAQLADGAARIRREAASTGNMARAWDASAAAAGALMLTAKARTEIQQLLRPPQFSR